MPVIQTSTWKISSTFDEKSVHLQHTELGVTTDEGENDFSSPQCQARNKGANYKVHLMYASSVSWTITKSPDLRLIATLVHNKRGEKQQSHIMVH